MVVGGAREADIILLKGSSAKVVRRFQEANRGCFLPNDEIAISYWNTEVYKDGEPDDVPTIDVGSQYQAGILFDPQTLFVTSSQSRRKVFLLSGEISKQVPAANPIILGSGITVKAQLSEQALIVSDKESRRSFVVRRPAFVQGCTGGNALSVTDSQLHTSVFRKAGRQLVRKEIQLFNSSVPIKISDDGKLLIASDSHGYIQLVDTVTGRKLWSTFDPRHGEITGMALSPDGRTIATSSTSDETDLWNTTTGQHLMTLLGHSQTVNAVAWSPDGKRLATCSIDQTIHVWDPATGEDLGEIGGHDLSVTFLSFLPGGRSLASFGSDGLVKIWQTEDRR